MVILGLLCWIGMRLDAPMPYYALIAFLAIVKIIDFGIKCYKKGGE